MGSKYSVVFVIAGFVGFSGVSAGAATIAKSLFFISSGTFSGEVIFLKLSVGAWEPFAPVRTRVVYTNVDRLLLTRGAGGAARRRRQSSDRIDMIARTRKLLSDLSETFWLIPAVMVLIGVMAAIGFVQVDRSGLLPHFVLNSQWLYDGGGTGARTLLGAVASSTIGVAGTIFSITIAALSLAAGQMGPRLLRNFTRDRGNQITLGIFLGTFSYALMVLRSVRTQEEGAFVPQLSLSISILLAFICVATIVYFVGHMAGRINVDTVIQLVSEDVRSAIARLTSDEQQPTAPPKAFWYNSQPVVDARFGYLQQLDENGLADWAQKHSTAIRCWSAQETIFFQTFQSH